MSKLLKREFTIKRKAWQLILEGLLNGVIVTIVLYFLLTECGDEKFNSLDYILIRKHIIGTKLTGDELTRADVNGDSSVNSKDYIEIRKIIMK